MTRSIMVPVDLAHTEALEKAIGEAATLADASGAAVTLVGVTGTGVTEAAHTPAEYEARLAAYGAGVSEKIGRSVRTVSLLDNDVAADLGQVLIRAAEDQGIDLIVMASHVPGFLEHIFASNAGYVASHAPCSVYVVR